MHKNYETSILNQPKLILLDRDGVINKDSRNYVKTSSEWLPIKGSLEAISKAQKIGIDFGVCTNQSGLGRGLFSSEDLFQMHSKCNSILESLGGKPLSFFFCPHKPQDQCSCRKPKPLLITQALSAFRVESKDAIFVGDSTTDMIAAKSAAIRFVLVQTGNGSLTHRSTLANAASTPPYFRCLEDFLSIFHNTRGYFIRRQD